MADNPEMPKTSHSVQRRRSKTKKKYYFQFRKPGKNGSRSVFRSWLRKKWFPVGVSFLASEKMVPGQCFRSWLRKNALRLPVSVLGPGQWPAQHQHPPAYLHGFPVPPHLNSCRTPVVVLVVMSINRARIYATKGIKGGAIRIAAV